MSKIDPLRHLSVFNPDVFGKLRVDVIGCGATGSQIAMQLAKLGVENLHLHDFDVVESHNLANQLFGLEDVGKKKTKALAERITRDTGLVPVLHEQAVTGRTVLGNVVFLLTDTMASRKEIWEGAIRYKMHVERMIETRMGKSEGRVYSISPVASNEIRFWEDTLYADDVAQESLCGARTSVGATACLVTAYAIWAFLRWFNYREKGGEAPDGESIFYAEPPVAVNRSPRVI